MTDVGAAASTGRARQSIDIRRLERDDLARALGEGWRDFKAAPRFGLFFGAIYALGGMALVALFVVLHMPWVGYPLAIGFALIAPFVAAGTYEVSRRLDRGEALTWRGVLTAVWARGGKDLGWMALVTTFAAIIWVDFAIFLFLMFFGLHVPTVGELARLVLSTGDGLLFAIVGNLCGAVIALAVFSLTVVSFPMLVDRDVDFVTAMVTSVRCVLANPAQLIAWAALIGLMLAFSAFSGFVALCVVLPVLGHASWRLYRRLIV